MSRRRFSQLASSRLQAQIFPNLNPILSASSPLHQERRAQTHKPNPQRSPSLPLELFLASNEESRNLIHNPNSSELSYQTPYSQHNCTVEDTAYALLVRRYTASRDPLVAESLHLDLIKKGFIHDLFLSNKLITLYARASDLDSAHKIFDKILEKNVVSWTCLITGYTQCGLPDEACRLFWWMLSSGLVPTQFTLGSVLRACQDSGPDGLSLGTQIHGLISKTWHSINSVVCNALIAMYGGCCLDSARYARRVFESTLSKNLISWNSIISVHSQRREVASAFELFSEMQKASDGFGLEPNEYTFSSLITSTYSYSSSSMSSSLHLLDQMLTRVAKSGFMSDLHVGSALVSAFARFGLLGIAKRLYLQMDERNAVSMNGLTVGLVKQNLGEEAVDVFKEMRDSVVLNCDSYVILLSALAGFTVPEEGWRKGREVHGLLTRNGLIDSKTVIRNGLVNMYAKCGAIEEACRVFRHMSVRDQVSWNSLISGLDQNGCFEEALTSFRTMLRSGVLPSNFAIISSLSSCVSLGLSTMGVQLHCDGIKLGLDFDISVLNSLLKLYGESGDISSCWKIFNSMPGYDQVSWNSMIGALADSKASASESVRVFSDMMQSGWNPNRVTFVNILSALSPFSILELNKQLHALVLKLGVSEDTAVENALLSCYAKSGEIGDCEHIFSEMYNRRDDVSWNSMVAGYIHNGLLPKAMDLVWFMMQDGQKMDYYTFATVLSACASVAALERGMEIHAFGIRSCSGSDVVVESALIDMYAKCGRIEYALRVFRSMPYKNKFSWNSMISGYARHGHGKKAIELFQEMLRRDQQPDHVTFVGVLSACSHAGFVEQGLDYFESMSKNYGLVPQMEHYSCVVDLLGRAGKLDKLEDFIKRMPINPNILIWRTVLVACSRKKDGAKKELGKQASEMLLELEPQNPANYVLTSNMYASKGRWDEVAQARAAMRGALVRKEAGCSWVTLRDGVHVFVAGDKSHPDTEAIYAKLCFLKQKLRNAGYVPQTDFALYDLELENKEELLSYHSEKLALAFVLTRSSGVPIRIMKNLRICGDCHSAFRYISKIVGRQIILRDSNRFHHFDEGKCSCGDYW